MGMFDWLSKEMGGKGHTLWQIDDVFWRVQRPISWLLQTNTVQWLEPTLDAVSNLSQLGSFSNNSGTTDLTKKKVIRKKHSWFGLWVVHFQKGEKFLIGDVISKCTAGRKLHDNKEKEENREWHAFSDLFIDFITGHHHPSLRLSLPTVVSCCFYRGRIKTV